MLLFRWLLLLVLLHGCDPDIYTCQCNQLTYSSTDWACILQPSRSLLIMLDMSGPTLQHIQHLPQWQEEDLHDFVQLCLPKPVLDSMALLHFVP